MHGPSLCVSMIRIKMDRRSALATTRVYTAPAICVKVDNIDLIIRGPIIADGFNLS